MFFPAGFCAAFMEKKTGGEKTGGEKTGGEKTGHGSEVSLNKCVMTFSASRVTRIGITSDN